MIEKSSVIALLNTVLDQTARLRKGGDQLVYHCVKCNHYKKKLEISLSEDSFGVFNCWVCHFSGNLFTLLSHCNASQSHFDTLKKLTANINRNYTRSNKSVSVEVCLPKEFISLATPKKSFEYKNALYYLKRRGIGYEDILRYNIGYCEDGEYKYHIIIPSYDAKGTLNFFIGRRYYTIEGEIAYKKPDSTMNIVGFESLINYDNPLNLCEGVFDAIAIRNNAIPLFGKFPSKALVEQIIINKVPRINIILDDDAYGDAIKNYEKLKREIPSIEISVLKLNKKDPSEMGFINIHDVIRNSDIFSEDDWFTHKLNGKLQPIK